MRRYLVSYFVCSTNNHIIGARSEVTLARDMFDAYKNIRKDGRAILNIIDLGVLS